MLSNNIFNMATTGSARNIPGTPQTASPIMTDMMVKRALIFIFEPTIFGISTFPSKICTAMSTMAAPSAVAGELVDKVINTVIINAVKNPRYGMIFSNADNTPRSSANCTPRKKKPVQYNRHTMTISTKSPRTY